MYRVRQGHLFKWWLEAPAGDEDEKSLADDATARADRHSVEPDEESEAGVRKTRGADGSSERR